MSIPDESLAEIATYDWGSLEKLCIALTIDMQVIEESGGKKKTIN